MTIRLEDAARWFRGQPHQIAAWNRLQELVPADALAEFTELYRAAPEIKPGLPVNPLTPVPYFTQFDNGPQGYRQCQASAIAMALSYLQVPGIRDDLDYLRVVQRYGDTTEQQTHRLALASLRVRARFRQTMRSAELMAEIKAGLPVVIGLLHHGPVTAPTGGGHYVLCFGFTDTHWICHDPYGELDLINGGWAQQGRGGRAVRYSFRNLNPRWLAEGEGSGWGWTFS